MKDPVAHYLSRHAEPEGAATAAALAGHRAFTQCVVVPAMGEGDNLLRMLASIPERGTLAIVVVNGRADCEASVHTRNAAVLATLAKTYGAPWPLPTAAGLPRMHLHDIPQGALLVIDRAAADHRLPARQGVGLARKIGTDAALALHRAGLVESPWLACTDADVVLPDDYFAQLRALPPAAAAMFRFFHDQAQSPAQGRAIVHYEASLRYYVHGLRWAGSPYAFHTVGSTLATHASAYARVRGYPKLMAAEDFYFLDKLRKVGPVISLGGAPLMLSGRISGRVPFGTGRAMLKATRTRVATPPVYHPQVFFYVRAFLDALEQAVHGPVSMDAAHLTGAPLNGALFRRAAAMLRVQEAIEAARSGTRNAAPRRRFLHTWFDAFRTLKLVHHLRDQALLSVPLCEAVAAAPFGIRAASPNAALTELARRDHRSYDSSHAEAFGHF